MNFDAADKPSLNPQRRHLAARRHRGRRQEQGQQPTNGTGFVAIANAIERNARTEGWVEAGIRQQLSSVRHRLRSEAVSNSNEARLPEHTSLPGGVSLIPGLVAIHHQALGFCEQMRLLESGHAPPGPEIDVNAL
jgi:hypothetical protein